MSSLCCGHVCAGSGLSELHGWDVWFEHWAVGLHRLFRWDVRDWHWYGECGCVHEL